MGFVHNRTIFKFFHLFICLVYTNIQIIPIQKTLFNIFFKLFFITCRCCTLAYVVSHSCISYAKQYRTASEIITDFFTAKGIKKPPPKTTSVRAKNGKRTKQNLLHIPSEVGNKKPEHKPSKQYNKT